MLPQIMQSMAPPITQLCDMVHASANRRHVPVPVITTWELLRSLAWATRFTYPYLPALLGVIEPALHELVGQGQGTRMSRH